VPTYIYPCDKSRVETKPTDEHYKNISIAGDTTEFIADGRKQKRRDIKYALWKKGMKWEKFPTEAVVPAALFILDR
jgi:hypothetical protein